MGTLFSQRKRNPFNVSIDHLDYGLKPRIEIAKELKISLADLLKFEEILELRRLNDLKVWDGDAKDEQLAGFGELSTEFNRQMSKFTSYMEDIRDLVNMAVSKIM